jgi:hypothetical protein
VGVLTRFKSNEKLQAEGSLSRDDACRANRLGRQVDGLALRPDEGLPAQAESRPLGPVRGALPRFAQGDVTYGHGQTLKGKPDCLLSFIDSILRALGPGGDHGHEVERDRLPATCCRV